MTRTERNIYPAALIKDRSVSKSGLDKSLPKKGAGAGNWGSITQETERYIHAPHSLVENSEEHVPTPFDGEIEDEEIKQEDKAVGKPAARRMSSMSDEERKDAAAWRKGAMNRQGLDLNSIARTSGAFSQSPPEPSSLSSSPVRNMNALAQKLGKY